MTSALAKKAGLKLFEQNIQQYTPIDPLYETYTDAKGRQRRRKREIPPGLSKRDVKILKSIKRRAHYLDKGFNLCGLRFGWTFFIGLIPGAGDVADAVLNYTLVLRKAQKAEIPDWLVRKMLANNLISAGVGLVPIVGDVILAQWKANSRNAALLEEYLRIRGEEFLKLQAELAGRPETGGGTKGDIKPGAGAVPGERIDRPKQRDIVPESRVPQAERVPQTPGGTQMALPVGTRNGTDAEVKPKRSIGGWFKRNKSTPDSSRFVEENHVAR